MPIICLLSLMICGQLRQDSVAVDGKLISENQIYYYVDFSGSKVAKDYCQNLKHPKLVKKYKCITQEVK